MSGFTFEKFIPGLAVFRNYQHQWLTSDMVAGLSVAAVALPVGIAYAQLAGFPPAFGLYSCILPSVAYAFFGTSRQLVINPDSAVCIIIMSTVAPLAAGNPSRYMDLSLVLTVMTGLLCIFGAILKLGVIANFLSRPILSGYLNGIALSIIVSQLGTLLGFKISQGGFFHTVWEGFSRLKETHLTTLLLGVSLFILLWLIKKFLPRIPAPLIITLIGIIAVYFFDLAQQGVLTVGHVPAGFSVPHIPDIQTSEIWNLLPSAGGIMLVSYCSMMPTARAFATKNGYRIQPNQDMFALGISNLASALSGGFAVSGADSRTVVADSSGGKTQLTTVVAASIIAIVLLFLTGPLALLPTATLAAILISSASGLFDLASLRRYYAMNKSEFLISVITTFGVMTIGVLPGILVAVGLALFRLLRSASSPHDAVLEPAEGQVGAYASRSKDVDRSIPGILIYRFDSSLLFFNVDYFKDRVRTVVMEAKSKPKWLIFDTEAIPLVDITGCDALKELRAELQKDGIVMVIARAKGLFKVALKQSGLLDEFGKEMIFYSVHSAVEALQTVDGAAVQ